MNNKRLWTTPETNVVLAWLDAAGPRRQRLLEQIAHRFHHNRQAVNIPVEKARPGESTARLVGVVLDVLARDHQISADELRSLLDEPERDALEAIHRLALNPA